ncbi:MAG: polyphosphate--nucleotide phosphotransferase [Ramlibacter sp.]|jgi:PPK2 family polyphosphate:nucleotide phosphotransferase|nr:polyphosphate--nucleotide phosphotransferase [Ramlibacter sp.]
MPRAKPTSRPKLQRLRHAAPGQPFDLSSISPGEKPFSTGSKAGDQAAADKLALEIDALQNLLFADNRHKLLVVLQGTDTSGKDGTLRTVFGRTSPLGVRTVGWKAPSEDERAHDFLWRIHREVPRNGEIVVFNRSHYEDVLVPWVEGGIREDELLRRYAQINDFERLLTETGTTVAKFMLHISKDEQRKRLQERVDDKTKRWKFQPGDLVVREKWDDYQRAYERAISMTGTPWAPWTVVPADSKSHRNVMIATLLKQVLEGMGLAFPDKASVASIKVT